ncbi:UDP-glycosyltransferase UGT5-like isoform X3 [Arctopsyche grandis]|uniref:UDP-glycosyltransferase UGT5-like isoform X3 n=1 Tax=Arctopsyche grandis TaxID=121162 RepID=UPI00406D9D55
MYLSISIVLVLVLKTATCVNILASLPIPNRDHESVYHPLMETLSKNGHNVTILTTHPLNYTKEEYPNLTQIDLHQCYLQWQEELKTCTDIPNPHFSETMGRIYELQLASQSVQSLMKNPDQKFELCFLAALALPLFPLKDIFNCSLILISSLPGVPRNFRTFGNPPDSILNTAKVMEISQLGFWERFNMMVMDLFYSHVYSSTWLPYCDRLAKKYFGPDVRSVYDIENSAHMLFLNEHPLLDGDRPYLPAAIIQLHAMHIRPSKMLPLDLQKILDDAKNGVVYLSLGSNVKSAQLSQVKINAFLEAFKELPYTVLWKWENETLPGKPANVHISKWLPQQDVLAHPNIKAFITQGGQQSMEEAIHHKVPLIGMPFLGDQDLNVRKMVKFGIGTDMNLYTLSKEIIVNSIKKVVEDPSYRENISKLSNLLTDQPQTSMERAVWWTEYVLRHKGAKHLRAPGTKVPAYQYFLLDIIAFVLVCAVVAIYIIVKISCEIHKRFIRKPDKPKKS